MKNDKIWQIKYKFKNKFYYDYSAIESNSKNDVITFWKYNKVFFKGKKIILGANNLYELIEITLIEKIDGR